MVYMYLQGWLNYQCYCILPVFYDIVCSSNDTAIHCIQEKQAKQQEEIRKQQIKHAELERQKKKEEDSR